MLILRKIFTGLLIGFGTPSLVLAQSSQASLERQITAQGYEIIISETTWLGRLRFIAVRGDLMREIVIGPGTGEVLRDVVYRVPGLAAQLAEARATDAGRPAIDLERLGPPEVVASTMPDPAIVGGVEPSVGIGTADPVVPSVVEPLPAN